MSLRVNDRSIPVTGDSTVYHWSSIYVTSLRIFIVGILGFLTYSKPLTLPLYCSTENSKIYVPTAVGIT